MPDSTDAAGHTRRNFLDMLLGITAVGWAASAIYPILSYLKPLQESGPGGPTHLSSAQIAKLDQKKFIILPIQGKRVIVLEDASRNLHAFNARCTHEGCTVQYVPAEADIWCACHNGRFDLTGRNISGPPPRPLERFTVERDDSGGVTVSTAVTA